MNIQQDVGDVARQVRQVAEAPEWWYLAYGLCPVPSGRDVITCAQIAREDQGAPARDVLKAAGLTAEVLNQVFPSRSGNWEEDGACGLYDQQSWRQLAIETGKMVHVVQIQQSIEGPSSTPTMDCSPDGTCVTYLG